MIIVNLFGVPGAGKSTGAAYIFSKLKMLGFNTELVTEFAKDKVWEESKEVFNNQAYIFGKQYFRISRCQNKVDVIVTDSPLLLSSFYNQSELLGDEFDTLVTKVFNSYESINILLTRNKPYNPLGRFQSEAESNALAKPLKDFLNSRDVSYHEIPGDVEGYDKIVDYVLQSIKGKNQYDNKCN